MLVAVPRQRDADLRHTDIGSTRLGTAEIGTTWCFRDASIRIVKARKCGECMEALTRCEKRRFAAFVMSETSQRRDKAYTAHNPPLKCADNHFSYSISHINSVTPWRRSESHEAFTGMIVHPHSAWQRAFNRRKTTKALLMCERRNNNALCRKRQQGPVLEQRKHFIAILAAIGLSTTFRRNESLDKFAAVSEKFAQKIAASDLFCFLGVPPEQGSRSCIQTFLPFYIAGCWMGTFFTLVRGVICQNENDTQT